jgi:predicted protein tyrosine phosphatase
MLYLKIGDNLSLDVKTEFGIIVVDFTVVHKLPNDHYALIAQDRLVIVKELPSYKFMMSDAIDLLNIKLVEDKISDSHYITL